MVKNIQSYHLNELEYQHLYQQSLHYPDHFWSEQAKKFIYWFSPWKQAKSGDFNNLNMRWFINGKLNACYNCVDRHLPHRKDQVAILWQGDNKDHIQSITYGELHEKVCKFANILKKYGVKKGDRVCIYLPMIPEVAIAMLACARIGAIHSVVFSAFSADALKARIIDTQCKIVITADEGVRGGKINVLKKNVDRALEKYLDVQYILVVRNTGNPIPWNDKRDIWYHQEMEQAVTDCQIEEMDSEDSLFILYTSGSTGRPKGILHGTGGYLVYVAMTYYYVFNYHPGDIYWCTADIGWITGHSYLVYGPLLNGATTFMFEGVPHYPTFSRYWEIIDQHKINIFYTSPTAIRALRKEGDHWVKKTSRSTLKILGTVGEPINPEVWEWYHQVVGENRCSIVDTWWQTETGGVLISSLPGVNQPKPGSAAFPFFGIIPEVVDEQGREVSKGKMGKLVIKQAWPSLMKTIYGDNQRYIDTYFTEVPGKYLTGDNAICDEDGYFWIMGRNDDVIKVSGHRIGAGEIESVLVSHPSIAEAAAVAIPHEIKGNAIYIYVAVKSGFKPSHQLEKELIQKIREEIGPIATPETIQWTNDLPKTRSGKIMRRILRKIACNEISDLGDISTLSNTEIIENLIMGRKK